MPFSTKQIELIGALSGTITDGLNTIFEECMTIYGKEETPHTNLTEKTKAVIGKIGNMLYANNETTPPNAEPTSDGEGTAQRRYILSQIQALIITLNDDICEHKVNKQMLPQRIMDIKDAFTSNIIVTAKKFNHPLSTRKINFATTLIDICAMLLFKQLDTQIILNFAREKKDDLLPSPAPETSATTLSKEQIQDLRERQTKHFNSFFPKQTSALDSPSKSQPSTVQKLIANKESIDAIAKQTAATAELLQEEHKHALTKNDTFNKSEVDFTSLIDSITLTLAILRQKNLTKKQKGLSLNLDDLLSLDQHVSSLRTKIPSFQNQILSLEIETNRLITLYHDQKTTIQAMQTNPLVKNKTTRDAEDAELRRLIRDFEDAFTTLHSTITSEETELSSMLNTFEIRLKRHKAMIKNITTSLSTDSGLVEPYTTALTTEHQIYTDARNNFIKECGNQDSTCGVDRTWHTLASDIAKILTDIQTNIGSSLDKFYKHFPHLNLAHEQTAEDDMITTSHSLKDQITNLRFEKEAIRKQYETKIDDIAKASAVLDTQLIIAKKLKVVSFTHKRLKPFIDLTFIEKLKEKLNTANALVQLAETDAIKTLIQQTKNNLERLQTRVQTLMISFGMSLKQNQKILFDRLNNNPDVNITDKEIAAQQLAFKTSVSETQFQLYADICNLKVNTALLANDAPLKTLEERVSSHNEKKSQIPYRAKGIKWGGIAGLGVTAIIVGVMITLTILTSGISLPIFIALAAFAAFAPLKGAIVGYTIGRNRDKNAKPKTNETPEDMLDAVGLNESQKGTRIVTAPTKDEINNRTMHGRRMQSIYSALTPDTPSPEQHTSSHPVSISESDDSTDTDETSSPVTTPASSSPPQFNLENSDNNSTSTILEILTPKPQLTFEELAEKATTRAERAIARHSSGSHDRLEPIPAPKANYIQHTNTRAETIKDTYVHGHSATFFEGQVKIEFSRRRASPQKVQGETSHPITPSKNTGT